MNDIDNLTHTKWRCQYHIVFAPKYRRQIIYGKYKVEIGKILRVICERSGVEIIEANACPDHIHMLVAIPPKMSVSKFIRTFEKFGMIEIINNVITIPNWNKHQSLDAYERRKARDRVYQKKRREQQKLIAIGESVDASADIGVLEQEQEVDITTTMKTEDEFEKDIEKLRLLFDELNFTYKQLRNIYISSDMNIKHIKKIYDYSKSKILIIFMVG